MKEYPPLESLVTIHGRTLPQISLPLFWTGSGVEFITDSTQLAFDVETEFETREQWIRVEIDGASVLRMPLEKGRSRVFVYREMASGSRHRIRLYKEVQPMPRDPSATLLLHGIYCDGEIAPVPPRPVRIEFVGDSISSGEGLAGAPSVKDGVSMVFSTRHHYAVETAQRLNADFRILSQSGWGVAAGWDNDPHHTMPPFYERVCGVVPGPVYESLGAHREHDFSAWTPDIVVVHLGYNDGFALDNPLWTNSETGETFGLSRGPDGGCDPQSGEVFAKTAAGFLHTLRRCNPDAHLVWAYGMYGQVMQPWIEKAVERYQNETGDKRISFVLLPDTPPGQIGSNNHPGPQAHLAVAEILSNSLSAILASRS